MKKTVYYQVSMSYCGGHLGIMSAFDEYSTAIAYFNEAKADFDNTDIVLVEIIITGLFKKSITRTTLAYCENRA